MRVYELARKLKVPTKKLLEVLSEWGIEGKTNLSSLTSREAEEIEELLKEKPPEKKPREKVLPQRDPIVTLLGHVDHGKTSLLDAIRNTQVAQSEVGGITQRIGASEIYFQGKRIIFIDTPGHEAFTAMRAQGAQVTDIAVLVIAADDGVMPQTEEAISHARAANVPILVAINKMDKENANPERVRRQLTKYNLTPEEWGGETICVEVSALKKKGLDELLEMILLQAEMMELVADPHGKLEAVVVESEVHRKRGPCSTLIVKQGTLKEGDVIVGGEVYGRARALLNWKGERLKEAGPSTPVQILGLSDVSLPGQIFTRVDSERTARRMAEEAKERARLHSLRKREKVTLESIFSSPQKEIKTLNIVLRADTQGSLKAVAGVLANMGDENVKVEVVSQGIGEVKKSDVLLASSSKAIIVGFNVEVSPEIQALASQEKVEIREYQIIYDIIEDIKLAVKGMLEPVYVEELIAKAEVRDTFRIPRVGLVAGCYVAQGKVIRGATAKIIRNGEAVGEGIITSLKRFDRDVNEISTGLECGMKVEGVDDVQKGDLIEVYQRRRLR
ncbi:translation initiation factor IF-2 [Candidatus Aerophobetes bacterium]|uniref:Translation initiation factor IF-2 n=1 Tax=Aerophobetes bacterium TaxID=2030807 RepID=A0A662DBV1_UNCAE|nr:MAG: translation initiation factor IF-2 [Candidatus Aerophobetes bacterium]